MKQVLCQLVCITKHFSRFIGVVITFAVEAVVTPAKTASVVNAVFVTATLAIVSEVNASPHDDFSFA